MNNTAYQMKEMWSRFMAILTSDDVLMYSALAVMIVVMLALFLEFLAVTHSGSDE